MADIGHYHEERLRGAFSRLAKALALTGGATTSVTAGASQTNVAPMEPATLYFGKLPWAGTGAKALEQSIAKATPSASQTVAVDDDLSVAARAFFGGLPWRGNAERDTRTRTVPMDLDDIAQTLAEEPADRPAPAPSASTVADTDLSIPLSRFMATVPWQGRRGEEQVSVGARSSANGPSATNALGAATAQALRSASRPELMH